MPVLSRRELLSKCIAGGLLLAATPLADSTLIALWQEAGAGRLKPTPPATPGPFYKSGAPRMQDLRRPGVRGLPLEVAGTVHNVRGEKLAGALVEVWQTDPLGQYDNAGFNYRGQVLSESAGHYGFQTHMPGHYPGRVAQHIHYKVSAPGHRTLVTQLFFATDPAFEGDPARNYRKDPLVESVELVRPVVVHAAPDTMRAAVTFEIVLEKNQ